MNCNDPDFSKPLPGQWTHWPGHPNFVPRRPPVGILADPFSRAKLRFCVTKRTLPAVANLNGVRPPIIF